MFQMTDRNSDILQKSDAKTATVALPPMRQSLPRLLLRIAVVVLAVFAVHLLLEWIMMKTDGSEGNLMIGLLALVLLAYALLIAVPFVPGVEIGISLMILRGAEVAPFVYLATVIGLLIAFAAGRFLPYDSLHRTFADLRMARVCALLEEIKPLSRARRLALLRQKLPAWASKLTVDGRYLVLALLINLPGNSLIGGGGGISLLAGLSRLFGFPATLLTFAIAVAPVPLGVWLFGLDILGSD